jgi:hypothetical protein
VSERVCNQAAERHNVYPLRGGGVPAPLLPGQQRLLRSAQCLLAAVEDIERIKA